MKVTKATDFLLHITAAGEAASGHTGLVVKRILKGPLPASPTVASSSRTSSNNASSWDAAPADQFSMKPKSPKRMQAIIAPIRQISGPLQAQPSPKSD